MAFLTTSHGIAATPGATPDRWHAWHLIGGTFGAANQMHHHAGCPQRHEEFAHRLLSSTDHDAIHVKSARLASDMDLQAVIASIQTTV